MERLPWWIENFFGCLVFEFFCALGSLRCLNFLCLRSEIVCLGIAVPLMPGNKVQEPSEHTELSSTGKVI